MIIFELAFFRTISQAFGPCCQKGNESRKESRSLREKIVHVNIRLLLKLLFSSVLVELLETEDLRRLALDDLIKQCRLNYPEVRKLGDV